MELPNIYKGEYRLLMLFPLILIVIAVFFIPSIKLGVDFTGGTLITLTLDKAIDGEQLQASLRDDGLDAHVRVIDSAVGYRAEIEVPQSQKLVQADDIRNRFNSMLDEVARLEINANDNQSYLDEYLEKRRAINAVANEMFGLSGNSTKAEDLPDVIGLDKKVSESYRNTYSDYQKSISVLIDKHTEYTSISTQTVSPALSTKFIEKALQVVLFASVLSVVFVFLFFRTFVPSLAVLTGAASDIVIALGAMGLFGIPLTLPSFAALLMLIGFSLDTDILLTMSITAIAAFSVLFILSVMTNISTYYEISAVALAGLVGDIFATWGLNAVILVFYVERKGRGS